MSRRLLFSDRDLSGVLAQNSVALEQEIQRLASEQFADANRETLVQALVTKYTPRTPVLREDQRGREGPFETEIDVCNDPNRVIFDQSRPVSVHGFRLTVVYPFEGDRDLFACRPNTSSPTAARKPSTSASIETCKMSSNISVGSSRMSARMSARSMASWSG